MTDPSPAGPHDLVITRLIDAPPERLFEGWTNPELMKRWFTPPPFRTVHVETDLRPGGASLVVMEGPDGTQFPNRGVYLEVVPNRRIVFTDAYTSAWVPSGKPFMTAIVSFEPEGHGTRYTAIARHWSEEDRRRHEEMGFHKGWGVAADQLEALVRGR
jgi:uncharacterized protein YndB with AHSA1/START domain